MPKEEPPRASGLRLGLSLGMELLPSTLGKSQWVKDLKSVEVNEWELLRVWGEGRLSYSVVMSFLTWSCDYNSSCFPSLPSQHMTSPWLEEKAWAGAKISTRRARGCPGLWAEGIVTHCGRAGFSPSCCFLWDGSQNCSVEKTKKGSFDGVGFPRLTLKMLLLIKIMITTSLLCPEYLDILLVYGILQRLLVLAPKSIF